MANQHTWARPFPWLIRWAEALGLAPSPRPPYRRPTCKLRAEALEARVVPSHGDVQYGFAHRVNDWDPIIDVLDANIGGGNVAGTGIEVDVGWGKPLGRSETWWARHDSFNVAFPEGETADEWLRELGELLQGKTAAQRASSTSGDPTHSYDETFASLWLDIKTPNDGDIMSLVQSVRTHIPSNVWVIYDLGEDANFGIVGSSRGYDQLKGSLRPNEGVGVWIEHNLKLEVDQMYAIFKADKITNTVVHHGHAANIDEDILELINKPEYHQADDPYRFKKVFTWTTALKSSMKEYINPSNAYHTEGQIVGNPAGQWGGATHIDPADLVDFANAVSESGKRVGTRSDNFYEVAPSLTNVDAFRSINEGSTVTVSGTFKGVPSGTYTGTARWSDGTITPVTFTIGSTSDGVFRTVGTFQTLRSFADDNPTATPFDDYQVEFTIRDSAGLSAGATSLVRVLNVAPTLSNLSATTINENGTTTLTGTINDPGTLDTFRLNVNWGDPLSPNNVQVFLFPAGTTSFQLTHQYLDDNPTATKTDIYTVNLIVTDDDTGSNPGSTQVTVRNVAPVITAHTNSAPQSVKAREGETVSVSGAFTDTGTLDTHTVSVNWGDGVTTGGTVVQGRGSGTFSAGHAYARGGIYTVTIKISDDDTDFHTAIETVFIIGAGVQTIGSKRVLFIIGTNQPDQVQVNAQANGTIKVSANFLPGGQRSFAAPINQIRMFLSAGDDSGTIAGNVAIPALLDGGAGNDHLSAGGAGSVVLGGPGHDMLTGSNANDVLIGGAGADRIVGNKGDDMLIGGHTSYDVGSEDDLLARQAAIMSILAEWNSLRPLAVRRANINGSGVGPRLNGNNFLKPGSTVFDDGAADKLTGSAGSDWFFHFPGDISIDFHRGSDLLN
jgi:Ca2+-binding RTX toxin-like protein